jgi:hypothetical protein
MLDMRPDCECCGRDLSPSAEDVYICSFECTFCERCALERLKTICPNCGGTLTRRPTRSSELLAKYPASTARKYDGDCPKIA